MPGFVKDFARDERTGMFMIQANGAISVVRASYKTAIRIANHWAQCYERVSIYPLDPFEEAPALG